jgi:predicted metal-dependent hydrolase
MSTLSLRLPDSLHKQVRLLARREGISINQLIASAAAEKVTALMTEQYLAERSGRGSREEFERVLAKVPDVPASPEDAI